MKNLQFFPFERNQYYYGKLLTYQDLVSEQKYLNDKRRLQNRFLHGAGVVSGLAVVGLDDRTLSVEPGVALDAAGREIVLEDPRVLMLDQIEGCGDLSAEENAFAYLCLAYSEEGVCPAQDAGAAAGSREKVFEKFREGGRIYLTAVPPAEELDTLAGLSEQSALLFENSDLSVSLRLPAYVRSGDRFDAVLRIEAKRPLSEAEVSFGASLEALSVAGKEWMEESFRGSLHAAGEAAEIRETLTAYAIEDGYGSITVKRRQLSVTVSGRQYFPAADISARILITARDAYHQMLESWYADSMNRYLSSGGTGGICLAKLVLKSGGEGLRIQRIEQLPFGQRVYNSFVNMGLTELLIRDVEDLKAQKRREKTAGGAKEAADRSPKTATGTVTIPLGIGGREGDSFFSGEIVHGLGLGRLKIDLSLEAEEMQYFGSAEVFEDMRIRAEYAAKANIERGSFVIGIRLLEATSAEDVRIRWTAQLLPEDAGARTEQRIRVLPDKPELRCMQSRYFRTETENLNAATILWEVCTPGGGTITRDGMYTAPDTEGIYEVRAFCQEDPRIRSSVFVIVRE